jgi:hypothetical protein
MRKVSRRTFIASAVLAPACTEKPGIDEKALSAKDDELLKLSHELHSMMLDGASGESEIDSYINRSNELMAAITDYPANSIDGLYVKARATTWAILDDFDPDAEETNEMRLVVSLLRDLVRIVESDSNRCRDDRLFRSVGASSGCAGRPFDLS